jgi:hypothetical protein
MYKFRGKCRLPFTMIRGRRSTQPSRTMSPFSNLRFHRFCIGQKSRSEVSLTYRSTRSNRSLVRYGNLLTVIDSRKVKHPVLAQRALQCISKILIFSSSLPRVDFTLVETLLNSSWKLLSKSSKCGNMAF